MTRKTILKISWEEKSFKCHCKNRLRNETNLEDNLCQLNCYVSSPRRIDLGCNFTTMSRCIKTSIPLQTYLAKASVNLAARQNGGQ